MNIFQIQLNDMVEKKQLNSFKNYQILSDDFYLFLEKFNKILDIKNLSQIQKEINIFDIKEFHEIENNENKKKIEKDLIGKNILNCSNLKYLFQNNLFILIILLLFKKILSYYSDQYNWQIDRNKIPTKTIKENNQNFSVKFKF